MHMKSECDKILTDRKRFRCPKCGSHTLLFLRPDTEVKNLPVKCKHCKQEIIVNIAPSLRR